MLPADSSMLIVIITLIGLVIAVATHIFVIARWSGRVDASLEAILRQPQAWTDALNAAANSVRSEIAAKEASIRAELAIWVGETKALRDARHMADGMLMRHDGQIGEITRALARLEERVEENGRN